MCFDGGRERDRVLADELAPYVEWIPVCPEVELGIEYLAAQTYLDPHPKERLLRNRV